jgi:integrase
MARTLGRLSALAVKKATAKGLYADGGGLYLQVSTGGAKSWIYRFTLLSRSRDMGLGSVKDVSLAEARDRAAEARRLRGQAIDPIEARRAKQAQARVEAAKTITFKKAAEGYIDAHKAGWRNPKHRQQWSNTLATYAEPIFGSLPVSDVDTGLVLKVIEPLWAGKSETANRLRGRVEAILDWAKVRGYRTGENPARWRGHLDKMLPKPSKVRAVRHHPALPHTQVAAFMTALRKQEGIAARGLEFLILTAARTSEVIDLEVSEIDLSEKVWTVPAERMKGGRVHRVPLSPAAVGLVKKCGVTEGLLFPSSRRGKPLSDMSLAAVLKRMGRTSITVHGFRSSFRDWAAECTMFHREVVEAALAHVVDNKVEAAYRRSDLFNKRRKLMEHWAKYCETAKADGKVVSIGRAR